MLSFVIGRNTYAIFKNGALYEIQCQQTKPVLQPTLNYNGKPAKLPLLNCYLGSSTVVAQLTDEGYLTQNVRTTLHETTNKSKQFLVYRNNTLIDEHQAKEKIIINNDVTINASNYTYQERLVHEVLQTSNQSRGET